MRFSLMRLVKHLISLPVNINELKGYVDTFLNEDTSNKIVVLPDLRGVGKATLILQLYEYLLKEKNVPPRNILYVSFDDLNDFVECNIREWLKFI